MTADLEASPVSRVVKLLEYLSDEIKKEADYEEDMYEKFLCWGKNLIKVKTKEMNANIAIVQSLQAESTSLQSEDVSLTDEKDKNMKEVERLRKEVMELEHARNVEKVEFDAASQQMRMAAAALAEAVTVMNATITKYPGGQAAFLAVKKADNQVFAQQSAQLTVAVDLAERFLHKGDASFVRRVLTGQVPKHDWKRLSKEVKFNKQYEARSGRILATFVKIQGQVEENLKEAIEKENAARAAYHTLYTAKRDELDTAVRALEDNAVERNAKLEKLAQMAIQVEAINVQLQADNELMTQCEIDMKQKKGEWKSRKQVRNKELEAIAKTIEVLHNDDARDAFTKSFKSQGYIQKSKGYTFLQERARRASAHSQSRSSRLEQAAAAMNRAAAKSGNQRLEQLAATMRSMSSEDQAAQGGKSAAPLIFTNVLTLIDELLQELQAEEGRDLQHKEECEQERAENTAKAIAAAREVDDESDKITAILEEQKELREGIEEADAQIKASALEVEKRRVLRRAEQLQYDKERTEDQEAIDIVTMAMETLRKFYVDNGLMASTGTASTGTASTALVQRHKHTEGYNPPDVWENNAPGYMGKAEESDTILYMMEQIQTDIGGDMHRKKAIEDAAIASYEKFLHDSETMREALVTDKSTLEGNFATQVGLQKTTENGRDALQAVMNSEWKTIRELEPGCAYYTINYKMRIENRQIEVDGLNKAKTYLQGGAFEENRELTVGDAS